ncbi:nucleotidyltransferase domain-containing protein [Patescibacteria group bacterium]|nr:nucleotidyltransferase domain-containing protein [Patescibacteria group bacterium]MCG2701895.1 nucleotidyltransferase domain-containing protein [Candidatus Parcubacteria bacterium]MBU4264905.1 nucleotidyltransferase domain-containing protein [Patescibacteria group bacterium]MBU4389931.1 nucleotidyltransferase domain-containing protein [Patescibacteria group bacterium]MBU4396802.1 nucleotidyltransferase domain-containing protein [Patescibacteria group bacterium]
MSSGIDKRKLKKLVEYLGGVDGVMLGYLVGSVAKEMERKDSDLDIVLIIKEGKIDKFDYRGVYLQIEELLRVSNLDLRLVDKKSDLLFLFEVINGKLLYSKDEDYRREFEVGVMLKYYDNQHIRNISHYYLEKRIEEDKHGV